MSLSNLQIDSLFSKLRVPFLFLGAVSKDGIPEMKDDTCVIINIQDSIDSYGNPLPGTHWVAAGKKHGQSWYFDSFGLAPLDSLKSFLSNPIAYNTREVQDMDSVKCGFYAIAACLHFNTSSESPAVSMRQFVENLDEPDLMKNDELICKYLDAMCKRNL